LPKRYKTSPKRRARQRLSNAKYRERNRERVNKLQKAAYARFKARHPFNFLKLHNASVRWYRWKVREQGGACEICGSIVPLNIDHDHKCCPGSYSCGECLRGLLCHICNLHLGAYEVQRADFDAYLAKYERGTVA